MMRRFAALVLCLVFCCTMIPAALADEPSGVEDGVLTVAMECNYAPYNWSQGDDSNGAVPIRDSREYANGDPATRKADPCPSASAMSPFDPATVCAARTY